MDPLSIAGLVIELYGIMKAIKARAKRVYYLKEKCQKFEAKIAEVEHTLEAAKLESWKNLQGLSNLAKERLLKLKIALIEADVLLGELEKPVKKFVAYISGEASDKLDALQKEIEDAVIFLTFHVVFSPPQEPAVGPTPVAPPPTSPNTYHGPSPHYDLQMLHVHFQAHCLAAYPSAAPAHDYPPYDLETAKNLFRLLSPMHNPSPEYRMRNYDPETARNLFRLLSPIHNPSPEYLVGASFENSAPYAACSSTASNFY